MSQTAPPPPPPAAVAAWQSVFAGGPYTSLKMLEYIMHAGGKQVPAFIAAPVETVAGVTASTITGHHDITKMQPVWASRTGRCTSFAVKAVGSLSRTVDTKKQPVYNFAIYDLAGHRVARCLKTEVVIDSSSTVRGGAFVLPEGQWQKFEKTEASWKFKKSESKFERAGNAQGQVASSSTALSPAQAMWLCLEGVESGVKYSIPTLFRTVDTNGLPLYFGMVSWAPCKRCIELVPDISKENKKKKLIIQWAATRDKGGTEQDLMQCIEALEQFVKNYGGPNNNGPTQWAADNINQFSDQLFAAAVGHWGNPKLVNKLKST